MISSERKKTALQNFCEKFLPGDIYIGERLSLEKYINNSPDPQATEKLLKYLCEESASMVAHPHEITEQQLQMWVEAIAMHADIDLWNLPNEQTLKQQITVSREVIRRVFTARGKQMLELDRDKTHELFQNLTAHINQVQIGRSKRVRLLFDELDIVGLTNALGVLPLEDNIEVSPCFLEWIGNSKKRENLAQILKHEYDWIQKVAHFLKAIPMQGAKPPQTLIPWKADLKHLVLLIDMLIEQKLVKPNKGKGKWKAVLATFGNNSGNYFKKDLAKVRSNINQESQDNSLIISAVEGVIVSLKKV